MASTPEQQRGLPAVLYAARSKKGVDQRSTESQIELIRAKLPDDREEIAVFVDDGYSGSTGNRGPDLQAAIDAATAAAPAELWVWVSNRLGRGTSNPGEARAIGHLFYDLRDKGVTVRSVEDDEFCANEMLWGFASRQASKYAEDLSAAVRRGKRSAYERGEWGGGPVPDGLTRLPDNSIVEDPTRAPIIRRIFELADDGLADAPIMRRLNADGLRTKSGIAWNRRRVQDTVTNAQYAGLVVWHRNRPEEERRPGQHPALVDLATFERIQSLRASRDKAGGSNRTPGRPGARYLLWRLATCARCGEPMRGVTSTYKRKDGTQKRVYACPHYLACDSTCDAKPVDAQIVETDFVLHLQDFFVDFDGWLQAISRERTNEREVIEKSLDAEQKRVAEYTRQADKLTDRYVTLDDAAEARTCARAAERQRTKADQAAHRLSELQAALETLSTDEAPTDSLFDFYSALAAAVRGALAAEETTEVNRGLRDVLERVELNAMRTEADTTIVRVQPVLRSESMPAFFLDTHAPTAVPVPLKALETQPEGNGRDSQA